MDIKKALEGYQRNKAQLIIIPYKLEEIKMDLIPSCTQQLSDMPKAHSISSTVEQTVVSFEEYEDIVKITKEKKRAEKEVQIIDALLNTLSHKEKQVLELKYKERKTWEQIAYELNYGDYKSARRIHDRIIEKLNYTYKGA
jgi:DNA-directed RNA polymerase specialized sigma subunit